MQASSRAIEAAVVANEADGVWVGGALLQLAHVAAPARLALAAEPHAAVPCVLIASQRGASEGRWVGWWAATVCWK